MRRRIARAALSFLVAWMITEALWVLWTRPWVTTPGLGPQWGDAVAMFLFVGGFAAIGWFLVVVPLVRFGDHDGWFFHPRASPLVGAFCGVGILLTEYGVFFRLPPWEMLWDPGHQSLSLVVMAGVFGAVLWWTYTRGVRDEA